MTTQLMNVRTPPEAPRGFDYAPQQPLAVASGEPDPNLMYTDPAAYQRQVLSYTQNQMSAQLQAMATPVMEQQSYLAKNASKTDPNVSDVWRRYEPEIEAKLASIPQHLRTKQLYDEAASIVRGAHWRDFAREEAQRLVATGSGSERVSSGGAMPAPQVDALDTFWDTSHPFVDTAKSHGMTKADIRSFLRRSGKSVDQYVNEAQLGTIVRTPNGGIQRSS